MFYLLVYMSLRAHVYICMKIENGYGVSSPIAPNLKYLGRDSVFYCWEQTP